MVDTDILDTQLFNDLFIYLFIYYIKQNIGEVKLRYSLMYVSVPTFCGWVLDSKIIKANL